MKTRVEMLQEMGVAAADAKQYVGDLEKMLPKYDIAQSKERLAHFFSQVLHESGGMRYDMENLNYSSKALRAVFGKYFKTAKQANAYARKPEKADSSNSPAKIITPRSPNGWVTTKYSTILTGSPVNTRCTPPFSIGTHTN